MVRNGGPASAVPVFILVILGPLCGPFATQGRSYRGQHYSTHSFLEKTVLLYWLFLALPPEKSLHRSHNAPNKCGPVQLRLFRVQQ
ncbi:protein of unknown function [Pseudomonas inefficax]|uniref:Uncharacterized protein n=1 Tax=Pseudomonas inefficax TaxID=2078786 RepID=A0AAQ1P3L5_9PSED|nr:protein of unknown function [Pseudomonas inefficax]